MAEGADPSPPPSAPAGEPTTWAGHRQIASSVLRYPATPRARVLLSLLPRSSPAARRTQDTQVVRGRAREDAAKRRDGMRTNSMRSAKGEWGDQTLAMDINAVCREFRRMSHRRPRSWPVAAMATRSRWLSTSPIRLRDSASPASSRSPPTSASATPSSRPRPPATCAQAPLLTAPTRSPSFYRLGAPPQARLDAHSRPIPITRALSPISSASSPSKSITKLPSYPFPLHCPRPRSLSASPPTPTSRRSTHANHPASPCRHRSYELHCRRRRPLLRVLI